MKKLTCVLLVLLLCMSAFAVAAVPSKSTADMVVTQVQSGNIPADSGFVMKPVTEMSGEAYAAKVEACQKEVAKLAASASVEEYFGAIKDSQGNAVALKDLLGVDVVNVNEFMPLVVENYDASYGSVTMNFQFSTPYAEGEVVVVLVGIEDPLTGEIVWYAFEGIGAGANGDIEVEFTSEILESIQGGTALMAVASK